MRRGVSTCESIVGILCIGLLLNWAACPAHATSDDPARTITGTVQYQDQRRAGQATVQIRDQEGQVVAETVSNEAGEFGVTLPAEGTYSVSAQQGNLTSEYVIVKGDTVQLAPVTLTLAPKTELAIEVVSPLPPLQYRASSSTYGVSRNMALDLAFEIGLTEDTPDFRFSVGAPIQVLLPPWRRLLRLDPKP